MAVCAVTEDSEMMKTQFVPEGSGIERIWNWGVYRVWGWLDGVHVPLSPPSAAPQLHFTIYRHVPDYSLPSRDEMRSSLWVELVLPLAWLPAVSRPAKLLFWAGWAGKSAPSSELP
ncbi:hypothetical protein BYT27DRAFT_7207300 [Phlegmacium glaucopus]|nr:hypothetical protein BYT27DRAFT_7207300 [Phlegmacium glaucopus]